MSALLLDTHVWIWYANGSEDLSRPARKAITEALHQHKAYLAAISMWEIGMHNKKNRIILGMPYLEWLHQSQELTHLQIAPLTPSIAAESCQLPGEFHGDPADQLIVATARVEGLTLATRDKQILAYSKQQYLTTIKA